MNGVKVLLSLLFLIILLIQPITITADEDITYARPTKRVDSGTFDAQLGNDVYFQGTRAISFVQPKIWAKDEFDIYSTLDNSRFLEDNVRTNEQPSLSNYDGFRYNEYQGQSGLVQAHNLTNNPLVVNYRSEYYDLVGDDDSTLGLSAGNHIENVVLDNGKYYGFTFNGSSGVPVALIIIMETAQSVDLTIIDPSNAVFTKSYVYFSTRRTEILPIVPIANGTHTVLLYPRGDTVLSSLELLENVKIEETSDIGSGTIKSDESTVKFLRYSQNQEPILGLNSLDGFKVNEFRSRIQINYGSTGVVRVFNKHMENIFGASSSTFNTDEDIIIAITAEVPYLSDPSKKNVEHLDLPKGVKLDYYFWITQFDIPNLPLNTDFTTIPQEFSSSFNYYFYSTNSGSLDLDQSAEVLMAYNTTGTETAFFMDPTGMNSISFAYYQIDLLNDPTGSIGLLDGDYIVQIPRLESMRFTTFPFQSVNTWNVNSQLNSPNFYFLPTSTFSADMFNISLNSMHNASVDFRFDYYDSQGDWKASDTATFKHIANSTNPFYDVANISLEWPNNMYNLDGMYLRVSQTGNQVYNSTLSSPTIINTDDPNLVTSITIERGDLVNYFQETLRTDEYSRDTLNLASGGSYSRKVNSDNNTVNYWLDLNLDPGAYLISITALNRSIDDIDLHLDSKSHFSDFRNFNTNINETLIWEFGLTEATHFGMFVDLGGSLGINGTFSINVNTAAPVQFPNLNLGSLGIGPDQKTKKDDDVLPFNSAIFFIVIPIIALIYRKKLKKNWIQN